MSSSLIKPEEREHAPALAADFERLVLEHDLTEDELVKARMTCRRLNRRAQKAESLVFGNGRWRQRQLTAMHELSDTLAAAMRLIRHLLIALVLLFVSYLILAAVLVAR
jgi:hypothetical protein